ncbi:cysteine protease, YopT-type domain protein, partial [Chlamydia psittaci 02DC14]
PRKYS